MIKSPNELARAPCFSGSRAGLITGFTCGTFDLELVMLDVVDCVHNSIPSLGSVAPATLVCLFFVSGYVSV